MEGERLLFDAVIVVLGGDQWPSCSQLSQPEDALTRREHLKQTLLRFIIQRCQDRETLDRMFTYLHQRLRAFPLSEAISEFIQGSKEICEKLPQESPPPAMNEIEVLLMMFTLSDLNDLLESLCPPAYDQPDYRKHDPYSNHVRHRIPTKSYQSPEAKVPPDRSSTRIESDFCSSIITVQRISPLRLFKIRWSLMPIIFPSS